MVEPRFISERIRRDIRKLHKNRRGTSTVSPAVTESDAGIFQVHLTLRANASLYQTYVLVLISGVHLCQQQCFGNVYLLYPWVGSPSHSIFNFVFVFSVVLG